MFGRRAVTALTRRPIRARLALLAHASTLALIAAAAFDDTAWAKHPEATATSNGSGGVGRNPNDLKDGVIDGNAGGQHSTSEPGACAGSTNVVGLVNITNATPMPLTGAIE